MNEVLNRIFKEYIKRHEMIYAFYNNAIIDKEEKLSNEHKLLFDIIKTMKYMSKEYEKQEGE